MSHLRVVWPEEFDARFAEAEARHQQLADVSPDATTPLPGNSSECNAECKKSAKTFSFLKARLAREYPHCRVCGDKSLRFLSRSRRVVAMRCTCCHAEWSVE